MHTKSVASLITKSCRSIYVPSLMTNSIARTTVRNMSAYSHMSDNDPEVLEKEKKKSLSKKDKEWNEKLASQSEAAVKADKEHDKPVKDMQSETLDYLDKKEKENNQ